MTRPISLAALTVLELTPPEMVDCAAEAGFSHVGIRLLPATPTEPHYDIVGDTPLLREIERRLAATGLRVLDVEIFRLKPETRVGDYEAAMATAARLGASELLVAGNDPDESRLIDTFAAFCDLAARYGLGADLEFMPWTDARDLTQAARIIERAGRDNAGVLIDAFHFSRSESRIEDIGTIPSARLHFMQLCDVPAAIPPTMDAILAEARGERLFPGEGGVDLAGLLRAVPRDLPLSIEVPTLTLAKTVNAVERARRALAATRCVLAEIGEDSTGARLVDGSPQGVRMATTTPAHTDRMSCDLLVVGSGASGLAAAVTAAWHGLEVIVVEKDPVFGGATAWSGGWMWVPGNPLAKRAGINEDPQQPRRYLKNELGDRYDPSRVDAFLDNGPEMVAFFETHTVLQFVDGNAIPDMHGKVPGAATEGHQLIAAPYDGRRVGPLMRRLRKTMRETSLIGMPIMAGADLAAFLTSTRSLRSLLYVSRRFGRHLLDLAIYGRAMQLVNGVALIARLAKSAENLGVTLIESAPATRLLLTEGAVIGAVVAEAQGEVEIRARKGVVLAAGGFPHDVARRKALFPRTPTGKEHLALPPENCSGDGITLGESAGGHLVTDLASPVAWAPVSKVPHPDGSTGHFPHIIDRAKPGVIGVLANGKRFVNEADGYYDYTAAMVAAAPDGDEVASWLIADHRFQRRYGLGYAKPFPVPLTPYLRSGYLIRGESIEALAKACGIAAAPLAETVRIYNEHARKGEDPEFGRGSTPYNRKVGDPLHGPNPCVAPIERGPFYAVKVLPGSFGTFAGLKTSAFGQVLDDKDQAIPGLYAVGTDMASIMGGFYPSGGINLGPAMTFGYIAGRHAAGATEPAAERS